MGITHEGTSRDRSGSRSRHNSVEEAPTLIDIKATDWTFTTDYCCSLLSAAVSRPPPSSGYQDTLKQVLHGRASRDGINYVCQGPLNTAHSESRWQVNKAESSSIDLDMLKRRDLPILFYDEITLYEDDLEDCGEVSIGAKLRVMPTCWFLVLKFFLRVDNVIVRCRETRLFHMFDSNDNIVVHMEVLWREKHLSCSATGDLSPSTASYPSATSPTTVFSNTATPALPGLMSNRSKISKDNSNDIPIVNEVYNIHQYYTLALK